MGSGDFDRGLRLLGRTAQLLAEEDQDAAADSEKYAVEVASLAGRRDGLLSRELREDLAVAAASVEPEQVLRGPEITVAERHQAVDISRLTSAGSELASALLVDIMGAGSGD